MCMLLLLSSLQVPNIGRFGFLYVLHSDSADVFSRVGNKISRRRIAVASRAQSFFLRPTTTPPFFAMLGARNGHGSYSSRILGTTYGKRHSQFYSSIPILCNNADNLFSQYLPPFAIYLVQRALPLVPCHLYPSQDRYSLFIIRPCSQSLSLTCTNSYVNDNGSSQDSNVRGLSNGPEDTIVSCSSSGFHSGREL